MERKRKDVHAVIQQFVFKRNRVHYLKWELECHWSIRFFFTFDNRPEYNMKWVLKNHKTKEYIVITRPKAVDFIKSLAKDIQPKEYFSLREFGKGYRRLVVDQDRGCSCFIETAEQKREGF